MGICGNERECLGKDKKRKYKKPNNNKFDSIGNICGSKDISYFKRTPITYIIIQH